MLSSFSSTFCFEYKRHELSRSVANVLFCLFKSLVLFITFINHGILSFLSCILRGGSKPNPLEETAPNIPIQYTIEGKAPAVSTNSQSSFGSDSDLRKDEKKPQSKAVSPHQNDIRRRNRALVVASKGCYALHATPFHVTENDNEIIISNRATGLNPIDYKSVDYNFFLPSLPWITGREMSDS